MRTRYTGRAAIVATLVFAACSERPTGPLEGPPIASLAISGVRINPVDFKATGAFELGLVASAIDGSAILQTGVGISATLDSISGGGSGTSAASYKIERSQTTATVTNADVRAAILIDDSGSMRDSDPTLLRASAATLFWESVLPARAGNQVAVLDFGVSATSGFGNTRLIQSWTSSASALSSTTASIRVGSLGTPLYESLVELSSWMTATTTAGQSLVILLLTDGQPNGSGTRTGAINAARAAGITIHGVGLGPASDLGGAPDLAAIDAVRAVSEQTGGVYSAATTAGALAPIFKILATVSSRGQLVGRFRISPVPLSRARVSGSIVVVSGGKSERASFSFLAP